MTPRWQLRLGYGFFVLVGLVFAIWYPSSALGSWVRAYGPNAVTGALIVVAIAALIDRAIDRNRREELKTPESKSRIARLHRMIH